MRLVNLPYHRIFGKFTPRYKMKKNVKKGIFHCNKDKFLEFNQLFKIRYYS
jgi:hypothetical protein